MSKKRGNSEGSIYHMKDGRWRAAIITGYRNGRPVRKVYTAHTRGEVQDKLTRALRDQQLGLPIVGERETVGHFLRNWLVHAAANSVRPGTLESYRWITEKHLIPGLGRYTLAKLSAQQIQAFLSDRLKSGRQPLPRRTKPNTTEQPETQEPSEAKMPANLALSPRTVQHIHATLRTALDQALRWNLVARNVATMVDGPRVRRQEIQPYSPEEAKKLLDALKGDRLEALYSAAMAIGLRQGEALGLIWQDVDFDSAILTIRNSLQRVDGRLQLVEVKAQKSRRSIMLPRVAVDALLRHRRSQQQERQIAGERWQDTGFIFTTSIGTPLDGSTVTHRFQATLKAAGLGRIRFHDLRHTCATLLLAQGVHPRLIMEILGHSQIAITMNLYAHVIPAMQKEVAAQIDAILATDLPAATTVATKPDRKPSTEV
jgi:integrase